jgi:hypothetical protein
MKTENKAEMDKTDAGTQGLRDSGTTSKEKAEMGETDAGTQGLRDSGTTSKAKQKAESRNLKPALNPQPSTLNFGETTDGLKGLETLPTETEANPQGWQMVAGGRSGPGGGRPPESRVGWPSTPEGCQIPQP